MREINLNYTQAYLNSGVHGDEPQPSDDFRRVTDVLRAQYNFITIEVEPKLVPKTNCKHNSRDHSYSLPNELIEVQLLDRANKTGKDCKRIAFKIITTV